MDQSAGAETRRSLAGRAPIPTRSHGKGPHGSALRPRARRIRPAFVSGQELAYDLDDAGVGREGRLTNGVYLAHDQRLLTRSELLADDDGRRALAAWESGDHTLAQEYEDRRQVQLDHEDVDEHAAAGDPVAKELAAIGYPASRSHEYSMSSIPVTP